MPGSGEAAAGPLPRHSLADKVEQAKQKVKAQGSSNLGPSSRLAAAVAGPIKARKRKVGGMVHVASFSPYHCCFLDTNICKHCGASSVQQADVPLWVPVCPSCTLSEWHTIPLTGQCDAVLQSHHDHRLLHRLSCQTTWHHAAYAAQPKGQNLSCRAEYLTQI